MSLKTCIQIIPILLKHRQSVQTLVLRNHRLLHKYSHGYLVSCYTNSIRHLSTDIKEKTPPKDGIRVYYGTLAPQIRGVKLFSLLTSFTGLVAQPFLYKELSTIDNIPIIVVVYSFIGFFTLVTPFLLHLITKKYVTALDYKPDTDTYVATTFNIVLLEKTIEFKPEDVKVPEVPGMFTSFLVKDVPLFVDPRLFGDPKHYGKLMGYDKPLNLKLYETSINEKGK